MIVDAFLATTVAGSSDRDRVSAVRPSRGHRRPRSDGHVSDSSPGPGWWLASDGKWYPPKETDQPPGRAGGSRPTASGIPPKETDRSPGPGWWLASDGKWYAPEARANGTTAAPASRPSPEPAPPDKVAGASRAERRSPWPRPARSRAGRAHCERTREPRPNRGPAVPPEPERAVASSATPTPNRWRGRKRPPRTASGPTSTKGSLPSSRSSAATRRRAPTPPCWRPSGAAAASRALGLLQAQIERPSRSRRAAPEVVIEPPAPVVDDRPSAHAPAPPHLGRPRPPRRDRARRARRRHRRCSR